MSDIAELFARDPLSLSKDDRRQIIQFYRERRAEFNLTGASVKKAPKEKAPPGDKIKTLDLDDLLKM